MSLRKLEAPSKGHLKHLFTKVCEVRRMPVAINYRVFFWGTGFSRASEYSVHFNATQNLKPPRYSFFYLS